jgi:hypothetical protein
MASHVLMAKPITAAGTAPALPWLSSSHLSRRSKMSFVRHAISMGNAAMLEANSAVGSLAVSVLPLPFNNLFKRDRRSHSALGRSLPISALLAI